MTKFLYASLCVISMRAPRAARQISYLYSVSVHAFLGKLRANVTDAALGLAASFEKVVVNGGT
jgi:hypothetical protein